MILDTDIIPFTTNSFNVYRSNNNFIVKTYEDSFSEVEEMFYEKNIASCNHLIGEFRIDSSNFAPMVGSFYGFNYYDILSIMRMINQVIKRIELSSKEKIENCIVKVATLYDIHALEALEPNIYCDVFENID